MMNERFVLVVSLWLKDADAARFEAVERDAALRMAKYGGRIERAIRIIVEYDGKADHPFEIHVVSFQIDLHSVHTKKTQIRTTLRPCEETRHLSGEFGRTVKARDVGRVHFGAGRNCFQLEATDSI
jgi:hypothetical protein